MLCGGLPVLRHSRSRLLRIWHCTSAPCTRNSTRQLAKAFLVAETASTAEIPLVFSVLGQEPFARQIRSIWHCSAILRQDSGSPSTGPCLTCQSSERSPDALFCTHCGALQRVDEAQSFFRALGLQENEFKINDTLLDQQYKNLQRQLHPDRFSTRPKEEQALSEDASAFVNEAFSTLKHPLKRAEYILKKRGLEIGEGTIEDPELLMGIMEAREAVELTKSEEELQKFSTTFQQQADDCIQGLTAAFAQDDLERAQTLTTLLRYVTRIQSAILERM